MDSDSWKEVDNNIAAERAKTQFRTKLIKETILNNSKTISPQSVVDSIIDYCITTTKNCRDFMEQNPGKKQPTNYKDYPGKFDHTTVIAFRVSYFE